MKFKLNEDIHIGNTLISAGSVVEVIEGSRQEDMRLARIILKANRISSLDFIDIEKVISKMKSGIVYREFEQKLEEAIRSLYEKQLLKEYDNDADQVDEVIESELSELSMKEAWELYEETRGSKASAGSTAIHRKVPSLTAKFLENLYGPLKNKKVLDWGCGRGKDVEYFTSIGADVGCYDPAHQPEKPKDKDYELGQISYVLNVIKSEEGRVNVVKEALSYMKPGSPLLITVRNDSDINSAKSDKWKEVGDGYVTPRGTYQYGFKKNELGEFLQEQGFNVQKFGRNGGMEWAVVKA